MFFFAVIVSVGKKGNAECYPHIFGPSEQRQTVTIVENRTNSKFLHYVKIRKFTNRNGNMVHKIFLHRIDNQKSVGNVFLKNICEKSKSQNSGIFVFYLPSKRYQKS